MKHIGATMNWSILENLLVNISFGLLLTCLVAYWIKLMFPQSQFSHWLGLNCTLLTNLCLFASLSIRWAINGYFPLSNLYESLIFLAWCFTFTQIVLEHKYKNVIIGAISSPASLFTIAFASFSLPSEMHIATPLVPALRSNWLMMHVTVMMISYSSLITGSLLSILFLIISISDQERQKNPFKKKDKLYLAGDNVMLVKIKNIVISNMTLLDSIDNLSYRTIGLGFPLLTVGIIAGAIWANEAWGSYWSWDPKETWALITWLIFASYLHSRLAKSWKGRKPAVLASIGFLVVWICYLGVNFLGKGLHSYGWLQ